ncbi:MAG: beta-1,6-N-acetylglucosaminyltransferase [Acidimicrobiales bacterium]
MTTAYLVMAHRDALMFRRLVAALPETASVYAHIDARVDVKPFEVGCPSVIFLEHRLSPNWASWTIVEVATLLLEAALRDTSVARCTLLSGQCYPILSPNALTAWEEDPVDHLEIVSAPNPKWGKEAWRFERRWNTTGRRKPDSLTARVSGALTRHFGSRSELTALVGGTPLYAGSAWWSFTRATAERAAHTARNDSALIEYFSHTYSPDESFWHTVVARYVDIATIACGPTFVKWQGGPHPAPLTSEDVIREARARRFAFARKFASEQTELLDLVDRLRQGRAP